MPEGVKITRATVERIARSMRKQPTPSRVVNAASNDLQASFLARLTTFDGTAGWSWVRVYPDDAADGRVSDWDPEASGDNAWRLGGGTGTAGGLVVLHLAAKDATGKLWYYFTAPGFWVEVQDHKKLSANRWRYAGPEMIETPAGELAVASGGIVFGLEDGDNVLTNRIEDNNDGSGVEGNSADVDNLPEGDELLPVRGKPRVWVHTLNDHGGILHGKFTYENHSGAAPPVYKLIICGGSTSITANIQCTGSPSSIIGRVVKHAGYCWTIDSLVEGPADAELSCLTSYADCSACEDDGEVDGDGDTPTSCPLGLPATLYAHGGPIASIATGPNIDTEADCSSATTPTNETANPWDGSLMSDGDGTCQWQSGTLIDSWEGKEVYSGIHTQRPFLLYRETNAADYWWGPGPGKPVWVLYGSVKSGYANWRGVRDDSDPIGIYRAVCASMVPRHLLVNTTPP